MAAHRQSGLTWFVEVAWSDAPLIDVASCTWTDMSAYVRHAPKISVRRGRTSELSDFSPGTMTVVFNNLTRLFDSSNTAGTYYGRLLPFRKIRFRVVYNGVTAYVFTGHVLGWPITYPGNTDSTVTVNCVDATRVLEQSAMNGSAYEAVVQAESDLTRYWKMQEPSFTWLKDTFGFDDLNRRRDLTDEPVGGVSGSIGYPIGSALGLSSGEAWAADSTIISFNTATIEMWVLPAVDTQLANVLIYGTATTFLSVKPSVSYVEVRYSNSTGGLRDSTGSGVTIPISGTSAGIPYHLAVTVSATTITVYINGVAQSTTDTLAAGTWTYSSSLANSKLIYGASDTLIGHVATYRVALTAAQILSHWAAGTYPWGHPYGERTGARAGRILDAIGWPAADRDLSTGATYCGNWLPDGASALSGLRELEDAEQGLLFISGAGKVTLRDRQWQWTNTRAVTPQVTFDDDGTDTPYTSLYVDGNGIEFIRNDVTVTFPGGTVNVTDSTSITAYTHQTDSVGAAALPENALWLARQLAGYRLRIRKDPATRVSNLSVAMRRNIAQCFAVASLEIGDRVQVLRRPTGGTGIVTANCQVQGIEHTMDGADWTVRLSLAPAPKSYTEAPYLTLGDATYGKVGATAGNLVPF